VLPIPLQNGTGFGILPQINHDSSSSQDFGLTVKHTKGAESRRMRQNKEDQRNQLSKPSQKP
jgi:hypothetical protein